MNVHIGKAILAQINKTGIKKKDLARRVNTTPQNLQDIFTRQSIDSKLLHDISKVLGFDFFSLYPNEIEQKQPASSTSINKKLAEISNKQSEVIKLLEKNLKDKDRAIATLLKKVPDLKKNKQK